MKKTHRLLVVIVFSVYFFIMLLSVVQQRTYAVSRNYGSSVEGRISQLHVLWGEKDFVICEVLSAHDKGTGAIDHRAKFVFEPSDDGTTKPYYKVEYGGMYFLWVLFSIVVSGAIFGLFYWLFVRKKI